MSGNHTHRLIQMSLFFVLFMAVIILLLEPVLGVLWLLICILTGTLFMKKHPDIWEDERSRFANAMGGLRTRIFGSSRQEEPINLSFIPEYELVNLDQSHDTRYPVDQEICVIGRSRKCTIQIAGGEAISREHCKIIFRKYSREYYIEDLHSRNGTYVGTRRLEPYTQEKLLENSELSIGGCRLKFVRCQRC